MRTYIKVVTLIAAFAITLFISVGQDEEGTRQTLTTISEATLPIVYAVSDGESTYNQMHGYTADVDSYRACDWVTILPKDRRLNIKIDKYNSQITGLSYEIRSKDGSNLYEDTTVKSFEDGGGSIYATLNIKNLLDTGEEYILKIKIATKNFDEVDFYTLVKLSDGSDVDKKIDFVKWFSDKTFDKDNLADIKKYIETKSDADNTNLGYVNIYSSLSMFGYGDLDVKKEGEGNVYIRQIDGIDAYVYHDFTVSTGALGQKKYYSVSERYTLSEGTSGGIYLMGYERYMEQMFDLNDAIMPSSRVYLGISPEYEMEYKEDEKERFTAFVRNADLYLYDVKENILTNIFSFRERENDNVREGFERHDIKIIDVDKEGNVSFAVYGYMNRGKHEGQMGISLCKYGAKANDVEEIAFVPVNCDYATLCDNFGDVIYINSNNTATFRVGSTLYSLDTKSSEITVIIEDLDSDTYVVSNDGMTLSYNRDGSIHQYALTDEKENVIECNEGETLKNIGYIDTDFIYGAVRNSDISNMSIGNTLFPMYKIYIRNEKNEIIKEYGIDGVYVTDYSIVGMRVNFTRMKRDEMGRLVFTDMDQLMNKSDNIKTDSAHIKTVATDLRKTEMYLQLGATVYEAKNVLINYAGKVVFKEIICKELPAVYGVDARIGEIARMNYQCNYSYKLTTFDEEAIDGGDSLVKCSEIVLSGLGKNDNVSEAFAAGKTIYDLLGECANVTPINLTGHELKEVLGFIASGKYVIAMEDYDQFCIITGYNKSSVMVYEPETGKITTVDRDEFADKLNRMGNIYMTYY